MTINERWNQVRVLSPEERDELMRRLLSLHTDEPPNDIHDSLDVLPINDIYAVID